MWYSWILFINVLFVQGLESKASHRYKRVVNGDDANYGEFPYQVSIQNADSDYHHCGGTIINEYYVLTAAHCLDGFSAEDFKIISGTVDLNKPRFTNYVSDIYVHEDYNIKDSWINDIGLIKVLQPFIFNNFVAPAKLPLQDEDVKIKATAVISGFGRTSKHSFTSKSLKKAPLTIEKSEFCNKHYNKVNLLFRHSQICAYNSQQKGVCKGDSGGPLSFNGKVIGIVSFTNDGCAELNDPSIFTKVSSHIKWIKSHTKVQ